MAAAAASSSAWVDVQHKLQEADTFKPEASRNLVDIRMLFDARERPEYWAEFETAVFADMQGLQSRAATLIAGQNENAMTYSLVIDIDPRTGGRYGDRRVAQRWSLEFRDVAELSDASSTGGQSTLLWDPAGFENSAHNLQLLLDHAQVLPDVIALANNWKASHKLMVGFVNPTISMTPTVSRLVLKEDGELVWQVDEHRNMPLGALGPMTMRSRPSGLARCGQFLRLTFVDTPRLGTTYMKVNGQPIETVFPTPLPEFDMREVPA